MRIRQGMEGRILVDFFSERTHQIGAVAIRLTIRALQLVPRIVDGCKNGVGGAGGSKDRTGPFEMQAVKDIPSYI